MLDGAQGEMAEAVVVCDRDIPGPWADYATVWRFGLKPPTDGYLYAGDDYFFW